MSIPKNCDVLGEALGCVFCQRNTPQVSSSQRYHREVLHFIPESASNYERVVTASYTANPTARKLFSIA
ncbi:MAG: hypothetical protein JKY17_08680 [Magnetovibrio sp.]|nr:hypothetical protein [Magnetovibrio sp.]